MKYDKDIIFLIEPFFHGLQYIEVLKKINCEYVILRRENSSIVDSRHETYIIDLDSTTSIVELIKKRAPKNKYNHIGIIPGNDFYVQYAFDISQKLGLISNTREAGIGARNKIIMRKLLKNSNVAQPKSICFHSLQEINNKKGQFIYPLVVKPADMTSSLFVQQVKSFQELKECASKIFSIKNNVLDYPSMNTVLIESFANGPEFSVELLLDEGEIIFSSVTEKHKGPLPHFVEIGHVVPSTITTIKQNNTLIDTAARAIGLMYGPAHMSKWF